MPTLQCISFSWGLQTSWFLMLGVYLSHFSVLVKTKQKQRNYDLNNSQKKGVIWAYGSRGMGVHHSRGASQTSSRHGGAGHWMLTCSNSSVRREQIENRVRLLNLKVCPQECISSRKTTLPQPPQKNTNWTSKYLDTQTLEGHFSFKSP